MNAPVQRPSQRSAYLTLMIIGGVCLIASAALIVYAIVMQEQDMADGQDNGPAEAAGFVFMTGLMPCALGVALLAWGIVLFAREPTRRK
jgi:hypothetical protein